MIFSRQKVKPYLAMVLVAIMTVSMISCSKDTTGFSQDTETYGKNVVSAEGIVVVSNGSYLIIENDSPISMIYDGKENIFEGLTTGDRIKIERDDEVMESYPGQVRVYSCEKLSDGDENDIPGSVADSLRELGWLPAEDPDSNEIRETITTEVAEYSYGYVNMSLRVPEGWSYSIKEYDPTEDEVSRRFGITLYAPEGMGELSLMYHDKFAVCGTELTVEDYILSGKSATMGTYGTSSVWSYIYCDGYVVLNTMTVDGFHKYRDDVELIVGSVKIADGVISKSEAEGIALDYFKTHFQNTEYIDAHFDYVFGNWTVSLYIDSEYSILGSVIYINAEGEAYAHDDYVVVN